MSNSERYKYNSVDVARYIIATANKRRITINITKVQKLLYIAYGAYLAITNERLTNEHPQAWPYGPVFPTTRKEFLKTDLYRVSLDDPSLASLRSDVEFNDLINLVFHSFGSWSATQLTEWSHSDGTPWERTTEHEDFKWGDVIPDDYIESYFKSIITYGEK